MEKINLGKNDSIFPCRTWLDTNGNRIQAQQGQPLLPYEIATHRKAFILLRSL